ncbi:outer membrane adhesin like protein [Klebsiella phage 1611E-K2-1]|uniref:outer membrane adhesin like protein n=1 Tax=Klebsiella phage 1611E-K2-1 TaxID=2047786 RepID=UPI00233EDB3B|nr:outer membrane adhesin like protein [Klebsiella phage 1611E-K2-1]
MNYKPIKVVMLRNNDRIIDVDGVITVTNFKMNFREDIVTFTATKEDGSTSERWIAMDRLVNKVVG